jgi:hypothetical protein
LAGPALDAAESLIEERRQTLVGEIGRCGEQGLTAAFLGEPGTPRVRNPDLHRSQARLAQRGAPLANSRDSCRRHGRAFPDALHVTHQGATDKEGALANIDAMSRDFCIDRFDDNVSRKSEICGKMDI